MLLLTEIAYRCFQERAQTNAQPFPLLHLASLSKRREREFEQIGCFAVFASSPVTQREFCLCFGYSLFEFSGFKDREAFTD